MRSETGPAQAGSVAYAPAAWTLVPDQARAHMCACERIRHTQRSRIDRPEAGAILPLPPRSRPPPEVHVIPSRREVLALVSAFASILATSTSALAQDVTFRFSGTVTETYNSPFSDIVQGTPFTGTYTFNLAPP